MIKPRQNMQPLAGVLREGDGAGVPVTLAPYGERVVVRGDNDVVGVPMRRLRRNDTIPTRPTLYRTDQRDWQVVVEDVRAESWVNGIRRQSFFPVRGLVLVGIMVAIIGGLWSGRDEVIAAAAPLLPHRVTDQIGRAYLADMGRPCDGGAGSAALIRLTARLLPKALPEPVSVSVIDTPEINAVALPGGHVALFRGLVEQAASADEVAAALAHEIEHVAFQHPNQNILRASGPAVIARALGGDAGKLADLTVLKKGDLAAEAEADAGAIVLLQTADVSTQAAADFFARQAASRSSGFGASHPADAARSRRFAAAARSGTQPALTQADWQALKAICAA